MPFDEEELDVHGECRHEIDRLRKSLKEVRDFLWAVGVARKSTFTDDQVKCFNEVLEAADAALAGN